MKLRKRVLAHHVSKKEKIALLVEKDHLSDYSKFLNDFTEVNYGVSMLLSDDEREADQQYWSEPNLTLYDNSLTKLEQWIIEARRHAMVSNEQAATEQVTQKDGGTTQQGESATEDVDPDDSASAVLEKCSSVTAQSVRSRHSYVSKSSSHSSSLRRKEEVNRAALLARTAALNKKQALQLEEAQLEAQLKVKKIQLKTQMEELDAETAIAGFTAKLLVLGEYTITQRTWTTTTG